MIGNQQVANARMTTYTSITVLLAETIHLLLRENKEKRTGKLCQEGKRHERDEAHLGVTLRRLQVVNNAAG